MTLFVITSSTSLENSNITKLTFDQNFALLNIGIWLLILSKILLIPKTKMIDLSSRSPYDYILNY